MAIGFSLEGLRSSKKTADIMVATGCTAVQFCHPGAKAKAGEGASAVVYVHGSHMSSGIYKQAIGEPATKALAFVSNQITVAGRLGAIGFVTHLMNDSLDDQSTTAGPKTKIEVLRQFVPLLRKHGLKMNLEPTASTKNFHTLERLHALEAGLLDNPRDGLGDVSDAFSWCFDSAHLHAGGVVMHNDGFLNAIKEFSVLRLPIQIIHLNGSLKKLGSGQDAHTVTGELKSKPMTVKGVDAPLRLCDMNLVSLGKYCHEQGIDIIIEQRCSPTADEETTAVCKEAIKKLTHT